MKVCINGVWKTDSDISNDVNFNTSSTHTYKYTLTGSQNKDLRISNLKEGELILLFGSLSGNPTIRQVASHKVTSTDVANGYITLGWASASTADQFQVIRIF